MTKIYSILIAAVAAVTMYGAVATRSAPPPAAPAREAGLTAWQCPITGRFFTNPLTCKANCSGYTCTAVHQ
jgi:hypothetical protein